jgi:hypothetical protein
MFRLHPYFTKTNGRKLGHRRNKTFVRRLILSKSRKFESVKLDLPVETVKAIKVVAKHCKLTESKVVNVLLSLRLAQMGLLK